MLMTVSLAVVTLLCGVANWMVQIVVLIFVCKREVESVPEIDVLNRVPLTFIGIHPVVFGPQSLIGKACCQVLLVLV